MHKHFRGYAWNKRVDAKQKRDRKKARNETKHLDSLSDSKFSPLMF